MSSSCNARPPLHTVQTAVDGEAVSALPEPVDGLKEPQLGPMPLVVHEPPVGNRQFAVSQNESMPLLVPLPNSASAGLEQ